MKKNELIGLGEVENFILTDVLGNPELYRRTSLYPSNIMISMDRNENRKQISQHIRDKFDAEKILDFTSSPDKMIEVEFDGSYRNFLQMQKLVAEAAVWQNAFRGIVVVDPIAIAKYSSEKIYDDFLKAYQSWNETAYLVIYVPRNPTLRESKLIDDIVRIDDGILRFVAPLLTIHDMAEICAEEIEQFGVLFKSGERSKIIKAIENQIEIGEITIEQVKGLAISLARRARCDKKGVLRLSSENFELLGENSLRREGA